MAGAVLRQQPAARHEFSLQAHTAVALAVVVALVPFLARPLAAAGIAYAGLVGWSRVATQGCTIPWSILAGAGIGTAVGGVILLALQALLHRAGRAANGHHAPADARTPKADPGPNGEP